MTRPCGAEARCATSEQAAAAQELDSLVRVKVLSRELGMRPGWLADVECRTQRIGRPGCVRERATRASDRESSESVSEQLTSRGLMPDGQEIGSLADL